MNTIVNVPAVPRAGGRSNAAAPEGGDGLEFQLALGLAAATQARQGEAVAPSREDASRPAEDFVEPDARSGDEGGTAERAVESEPAGDASARDAAAHAERTTRTNHEPRARAAAETPGTAQNAATPASAAGSAAARTSMEAPKLSAVTPVPVAPAGGPAQPAIETSEPLTATLPVATGAASVRVVAAKLATRPLPQPVRAAATVAAPVAAAPARPAVETAEVPLASATSVPVTASAPPAGEPVESASPGRATPLVTPPPVRLPAAPVEEAPTAGEPARRSAPALANAAAHATREHAPSPNASSVARRVVPVATTQAATHTESSESASVRGEGPQSPVPAVTPAANHPRDLAQGDARGRGEGRPAPRGEAPVTAAGDSAATAGPPAQSDGASTETATPAPAAATATAVREASGGSAPAPRTGVPVANTGEAAVTPGVTDPRLEPMRRAADQVTLQFRGEAGLEGRLRISVRGDAVRAAILSSHDGTLQRAGGELGALRRALAEQGFTDAKVSVQDTRALATTATNAGREQSQAQDDRRQGEPRQQRNAQGRETRQDGGGANRGRRESRDERRDA